MRRDEKREFSMRRSIVLLIALVLALTACGSVGTAAVDTDTVTADAEIGVPTTAVLPMRLNLSRTSWHVETIDEADVVGLEIEFSSDPESNVGRLTASYSGPCEVAEATLLPVTDETFLVESQDAADSEACSAGDMLSALFTPNEVVTAELTRPGLRLSTATTTVSAEQIFVTAEAVAEWASVCTPLNAYQFTTTIPGEWWCEE
jgi:hypothetical protein